MAINRVSAQDAVASGSPAGGSLTATYPGATAAGDLLVAVGLCRNTAGNTTDPSGWTRAVVGANSATATDYRVFIWFKIASGAETTVSFSQTGNPSSRMELSIFEYTGIAASPLDQVASNTGTASTVTSFATGTTPTTTQADELIIEAVAALNGAITSPSFSNGTLIATVANTDTLLVAQRIVSSTGAYSDTASWTTARIAAGAIATFFAAILIVDTDTSSGTDAGENITATITDADTGSGLDGGEAPATSDSDTASGADAGESIAASLSAAETGAGVDTEGTVALADTDTGVGADGGEAITATLSDTDTASGTDAGESVSGTSNPVDSDTGSGADGGETITVTLSDGETAAGADTSTLSATQADADTAAASDGGEAIAAILADADFAATLDAELLLLVTLADSDTGSGLDNGTAADLGASAPGTLDLDLVDTGSITITEIDTGTLTITTADTGLLSIEVITLSTSYPGTEKRISIEVRNALTLALTDPDTLTVSRSREGVFVDSYEIGDLEHDSLGKYHVDLPFDLDGQWWTRGRSTGAVVAVAEQAIKIRASNVPAPTP